MYDDTLQLPSRTTHTHSYMKITPHDYLNCNKIIIYNFIITFEWCVRAFAHSRTRTLAGTQQSTENKGDETTKKNILSRLNAARLAHRVHTAMKPDEKAATTSAM